MGNTKVGPDYTEYNTRVMPLKSSMVRFGTYSWPYQHPSAVIWPGRSVGFLVPNLDHSRPIQPFDVVLLLDEQEKSELRLLAGEYVDVS